MKKLEIFEKIKEKVDTKRHLQLALLNEASAQHERLQNKEKLVIN